MVVTKEVKQATRIFPKMAHGKLPEVDQFIEPGPRREGPGGEKYKAADPRKSWFVDTRPFKNLTDAREHVIATLELSNSTELHSEVEFTPASGYTFEKRKRPRAEPVSIVSEVLHEVKKEAPILLLTFNPTILSTVVTKGNDEMNTKKPTPNEIKIKELNQHLAELNAMDPAKMTPSEQKAHEDNIRRAKSNLSYHKSRAHKHRTAIQAQHHSATPQAPTPMTTPTPAAEHIKQPEPAMEKPSAETFSVAHPNMDRMGEPQMLPRYEVSIQSPMGMMTVKVNSDDAMSNFLTMMKKSST